MIQLFNINHHIIDTSKFSNLLHDSCINELENSVAEYVGAKYAVSFNSATNALFLALLNKNETISIPSIIPPVVANAILTSNNKINFYDDISWVGDSYILHKFQNYKIVDSAQKLEKNQFIKECDPQDLMVFSFYPTKPIGSCDGGLIVSNDIKKINFLREMAFNGMTFASNNWDRQTKYPGYKFYMNSLQAYIAIKNFEFYEHKLELLDSVKKIYNSAFNLNNTSNHLYRIRVKNNQKFIEHMKQKNIQCGIHYKALHLDSTYSSNYYNLESSEIESKSTASIPFHEKLTASEINYIIDCVKSYND